MIALPRPLRQVSLHLATLSEPAAVAGFIA
jgi:hypothetical protein